MYQSIDSENLETETNTAPEALSGAKRWLWPAIITGLAICVIVAGIVYVLHQPRGQVDPIGPDPSIRQAYLKALGETDPALRRARLTDYLNQYPESARVDAVNAQLAILDGAADRDWQATLTLAYDPRFDLESRRAAVEAYQRKWGRYLGARDAEIEKLREDVETLPTLDNRPDRTLPRDPEAYRGIPDDRLAGGRFGSEPRVIFRSSREMRNFPVPVTGDVIGPTVRREVTPRYPSRAERRGVEAMVTLSLTVDRRGRVSLVEVVDVEADRYERDFVRAAERAALRAQFDPRTVDGEPVEASNIIKRYRFELD